MSPLLASAMVQRGQLWRLLTSVLLHGGFFHLLFDCYWTWVFGAVIEATLGSLATIGLFVLFAAASSAAQFAFLDGGIGLSGIVYGLFGFLWMAARRDRRFIGAVDYKTVQLFLVWFVICIVTTYTGIMNIANIAHGAGLVIGVLVGAAMGGIEQARSRRITAIGGATVFTIAALAGATVLRPFCNFSKYAAADNAEMGYHALMANHNKDAIAWLNNSKRMDPRVANTWYNLGIAYGRVNSDSKSAAAYAKAHQLEPSNSEYREAAASP